MAEFTNANAVTVAAGQNVPLTETAVAGKPCLVHREGAGNVALPDGATVADILVALSINGEPLTSATARVTPTAAGDYANIFVAAFIEVPRGCCTTVAAKNASTQEIIVANANMIAERVA